MELLSNMKSLNSAIFRIKMKSKLKKIVTYQRRSHGSLQLTMLASTHVYQNVSKLAWQI